MLRCAAAQAQAAAGDVAKEIERQRLPERMQQSADAMRAATEDPKGGRGNTAPRSTDDPRAQAASQQELAQALDKAADKLASATGSQDGESQKLSEQRARAQELRDRLNETSRALGQLAQAGSRPGRAGRQIRRGRTGRVRDRDRGQSGQRAEIVGRLRESRGRGRPGGGGTGTDLDKLREQYQRQLQETKELADQMRRDDPSLARGGGGGFTFEAPTASALSAPGTEAFKQDFAKWEELRRQATLALDNVESSLSKKLQAKQAHDRLAAGADDKAPAGYQQQVDNYFKAIAGKKKPELRLIMHFAYPLPWWLAVLLAAAIGAVVVCASTGVRCRRSRARSAACWWACARSRSPRSSCSCSGRSCAAAGRLARRVVPSSSTSRAACGSPTRTARRASRAPPRC